MEAQSPIPGRAAFATLWEYLGARHEPGEALVRLYERHHGPRRKSHDWLHVVELLGKISQLAPKFNDPLLAQMAALYHAVFYEPLLDDNHARSAGIAALWLIEAKVPRPTIERISGLIRASALDARPTTADEALFHDAEWAVLGADEAVLAAYIRACAEDLQAELYPQQFEGWLLEFAERIARLPRIFHSDHFAWLERQARLNFQDPIRLLAP